MEDFNQIMEGFREAIHFALTHGPISGMKDRLDKVFMVYDVRIREYVQAEVLRAADL